MEILKLLLTCVCTNDAVLLSKVVLVIGMICTIINALKKQQGCHEGTTSVRESYRLYIYIYIREGNLQVGAAFPQPFFFTMWLFDHVLAICPDL